MGTLKACEEQLKSVRITILQKQEPDISGGGGRQREGKISCDKIIKMLISNVK